MKRREFFKKSFKIGLGAGAFLALGDKRALMAAEEKTGADAFDLVAIKGGEPDVMFDRGMAAMGGMKKFVKPNQTVVIKPNIGWDVEPERAGNTNPLLVKQIIKQCLDAGAKDVFVFDHTCDNWVKTYANSGIEASVRDAGGKIVPGNTEKYYQSVSVPGGKNLTEAKVHELILESDVFINVPILKSHSGATLTMAMKNLMGVVWDRGFWHRNDLHQCIADCATFRKPDLNVVDAYYVMKKNGPRGVSREDVVTLKSQIIATDMVSADAAAAKLFGMDPAEIPHIVYADQMGVGKMDLTQRKIHRIVL
ncbi:MAG: DUF362 domain-containing protein [Proteobacteria bacterium]|nr:DUF362 domain-containing protein [Pseudomonadota bacterium]MBU4472332.1 DUF362 domain-containing protein [Pseudomonadota bacterium]MCG2752028.1 DUF362 domain-containing protein [Desulfobacteraceae bacterium]